MASTTITEAKNVLGIPDSIYTNPLKCLNFCESQINSKSINTNSEKYFTILIELNLCKVRLGQVGIANEALKKILYENKTELSNEQIVTIYKSLTRINELLGAYNISILYGDTAISLAAKYNFKTLLGSAHLNRGNSYAALGYLEKSIEDYHNAQNIFEENQDSALYCMTLGNIGNIYVRMHNLQKALEYYDLEYKEMRKQPVSEALVINTGNRGYVRMESGDLSKTTEQLLLSSLILSKKNSINRLSSWAYNTLGVFYQRKKQFIKAIALHNEALDFAVQTSNHLEEARILASLASNHLRLARHDSAEYYSLKSIEKARSLNDTTLLLDVLENASTIAAELGNWEKSTELLGEWKEIYTSSLNKEKTIAIAEIEEKYQNSQLQLRNAEQKIELDNYRIIILSISLLLIILILLFVFLRLNLINKKQKLESEVTKLKQEIISQYKDTDVFSIENLKKSLPSTSGLSIQDYELIELIVSSNGSLNNKQMAAKLNWSEHTLRYHKKKLVQEFDIPGGDTQQILGKILVKIKDKNPM